jgi:tRNA nucleotidyltransferase (CCA-adding enzyme)
LGELISDDIRKEVLTRITPSDEELRVQTGTIKALRDALVEYADVKGFQYSFVEPQGSTGKKQTQLRNVADIDLFVGLDPSDHSDILEKPQKKRAAEIDSLMTRLVEDWFVPAIAGLDVSKSKTAYSQHPYLSLQIKGLEVDILGCFDIDSDTLSKAGPFTAVDRTVHHTKFVAENLTGKTREDARILKSFVRACHAYGDRCAVGRMGLTGVSLELLAIESNDLDKAFESLELLDERPIDPKGRPLPELRKIQTFRDDYVYLIDPTDLRRNIASSFTPRSYRWVKHRIGLLRKMPEESIMDMLLESPIPDSEPSDWLKDYATVVEFQSDGSAHYTILRDKLYRVSRKVQAKLSNERTGEPRFGMSLMEVYFEEYNYAVGFVVEHPLISEEYTRRGPPSDMKEASEEFLKKHPKAQEKDGYYWTTEKREWSSASKMIEHLFLEGPIKGLSPTKQGSASRKVLNVIEQYIYPIEPDLPDRITRVKERFKK